MVCSSTCHSPQCCQERTWLDTVGPHNISSTSDIREHFNAARHVIQLHDELQQKLWDLTADMGLSDLELPQQMTNTDREYLKKYMLAWAWQHGILIWLTKYQEEMSPIQSTQCQGQQLVSKIGKSHSCDGCSGSSQIMFQDTKQWHQPSMHPKITLVWSVHRLPTTMNL